MPRTSLTLLALPGLPRVAPGDDLGLLIAAGLAAANLELSDRDVLVVAQKIVSKSEGRFVDLAGVAVSEEAKALARDVEKDPRIVELILRESVGIVARRQGLLIVEHRLGFVMANAGLDQSNIGPGENGERVLLLPEDPDASCAALRQRLSELTQARPAVVMADSFGRPWRSGVVGVAIGAAGLPALEDRVGSADLYGRALQVTETALADQIAAAASMVMGEADESQPVVLLRGLQWSGEGVGARELIRDREQDLFR